MSDKYYEVKVPTVSLGSGKKWWHRIGSATNLPDGSGIAVTINYIPLNWDGQCFLFPSKKESEA